VTQKLHKTLVVGAGSIGERHLRCFLSTHRSEVAFVEVRAELSEAVAGRYPGARAFISIEHALADSNFTAAVIATPAPLHVPQALQFIEQGTSVLIEKPLSTSLNEVDRLAQAVQRSRLTAGVAYVYRANPALAQMRDAILSGKFGRPVELIAVCGQHFPHYRPAYRDTYYTRHETGGGAIQDALTHVINAGEWLVGPVSRVAADANHQVLPGVNVEDTVHVLARHGDVMGCYALNQHQAPNESTITVVCECGTTRIELHRNRWMWTREPETAWHEEPSEPPVRDAQFIRQADAFLDAVEGRQEPLCTLDEGIQTLKVNLAILRAVREQRWEAVS
jgi:predicted dehydrogenase